MINDTWDIKIQNLSDVYGMTLFFETRKVLVKKKKKEGEWGRFQN